MTLFPHFIARLGGASYSVLDELLDQRFPGLVNRLLELNSSYETQAARFSEQIHQVIAVQQDGKVQNKLLNVRRSIHNRKSVSVSEKELSESVLTGEVLELFHNCLGTQQLIQEEEAKAEQEFNEGMRGIRQRLASIAGTPSLQKGLLLSSQPLLNNVIDYQKTDLSKIRKKELKTEESLVKYLTRMSAKTSPFSTFTNLTTNTYGEYKQPLGLGLEGDHSMISHISLNNNLYGYLRGLFLKFPEIYRLFEIRLNPTISLHEEVYSYLTNNANVESFQRLPHNPVVELFHDLIRESETALTFGGLVKDIVDNEYIDAEVEDIEEYINQLIGFGFIEFNFGVSGIDPYWDRKLCEVLEEKKEQSAHIPLIISALKKTRELAGQYAVGSVEERRRLLNEAHLTFRDMVFVIHEAAGLPAEERKSREELEAEAARKQAEREKNKDEEKKEEKPEEDEAFTHQFSTLFHFKPEQMFYEDTTSNLVPQIDEASFAEVLKDFKTLLYSARKFDGFLDEMEKMTDFYQRQYPGLESIPVMRYYEDYFREVKIPEAKQERELKEKKEGAQPKKILPVTEERRKESDQLIGQLTEKLKSAISDRSRVNISKELFASVMPSPEHIDGSCGSFIQPFVEDGKLQFVANSYFPGYGKMYSRFLHIFPNQLTEDLKKYNVQDAGNTVLVENCDASMFNANLHPPLMPFEIWMPGGQNTLPTDQQVPITDLAIRPSEAGYLELVHTPSGNRCYVFDLGFQGQRGRSQLFQLLSRFNPTKALQWYGLTNAVNNAVNPENTPLKEGVSLIPRITFNDRIVIQRKRWIVRKDTIPMATPQETEWQCYKRINNWRLSLNIPDEAFIFLSSYTEQETLEPEQMKKMGRDGYKPQYMNFTSPLLVNLLDKMLDKIPVGIRVEEMLPGSAQMMQSPDGRKWVSELVVQWYDKESASGNAAQNEAQNLSLNHSL